MTDYVKSTNFTSKDSLATGNPLKIIKGAEFDTEFNNIVTAIDSKANSLSPSLTGTPLAPTATAGTNTTQIATTAFVTGAVATADAPTKAGVGATGTWPISITGNAATATSATTASSATTATTAANGGVTSVNGQTGAVVSTSLWSVGLVICGRPPNNTNYQAGDVISGGSLYSCSPANGWDNANSIFSFGNTALVNTGSWRCVSNAYGTSSYGYPGFWVRYA